MSDHITREMAYTDWRSSCREPHPELEQVCRRANDHQTPHASGFGSGRVTWEGPGTRFDYPVIPIAQRAES